MTDCHHRKQNIHLPSAAATVETEYCATSTAEKVHSHHNSHSFETRHDNDPSELIYAAITKKEAALLIRI